MHKLMISHKVTFKKYTNKWKLMSLIPVFSIFQFSISKNFRLKQIHQSKFKAIVKIQSNQSKFKVIRQNSKSSVKIQSYQSKFKAISQNSKQSSQNSKHQPKFKAITQNSKQSANFRYHFSVFSSHWFQKISLKTKQINLFSQICKDDTINQRKSTSSAKIQSNQPKFKAISKNSKSSAKVHAKSAKFTQENDAIDVICQN